jgi:transcriptional regulator with XRE-family HTH domain
LSTAEWKRRLVIEIKGQVARGRNMREISQSAGLGPNFVQQLVNSDKSPSVDALIALCGSLKIPVGHLFPDEQETSLDEIVSLVSKLRAEDFRVVLELAEFLSLRNRK